MSLSRRDILRTASSGAALAAVAPGLKVALAQQAPTKDTLIVIYLRGAQDGLQWVAPAGDANYISNRPTIRVRTDGNTPGIGLGTLQNVDFYFHPTAADLKPLYDQKKLAIVHAAGLRTEERSHFEVQELMELGANRNEPTPSDGWLARHLKAMQGTRPVLGAVSIATNNPDSLLGYGNAVAIASTSSFAVSGGNNNANIIRALNGGQSGYEATSIQTLDAINTIQTGLSNLPVDSTNYGYPGGALTNSLRSLASLFRLNIGVEVAHIDMGGWDHHNNLIGEFNARGTDLARSLAAFWREIANYQDRVTVVTMTEFGRRFRENASQGTDHGPGGVMMVLGGGVNGGRIYGTWPGLASNQLFNGDLDVSTDYRRVMGEILAKRQGNKALNKVFPTIRYEPMGIVNGDDTGVVGGNPNANPSAA
ncbi:MAG: DUF1501 domain-containing protein [Rhodospirillaceae bacterium]|nr:DUF1501 domain-containing protein [Rhodospirillaceae bacterium]